MGHISKHSKGARFIAFFVIYFQWYLFLHPPSYLSCFILNFCFGTLLTKVSETLWCSQKNLQANTHLHTYTRTDTPVSTVTVLQRAESAAAAGSTLLHCTWPRQKKIVVSDLACDEGDWCWLEHIKTCLGHGWGLFCWGNWFWRQLLEWGQPI